MASFTFQPYYGASRGAFPACAYPYPQRSRGRCGSSEGACGPSSSDCSQESSLHPFFQFFKEVDNALATSSSANHEQTTNEKPQEATKPATKSNDKPTAPACAPSRRHGHGHRRHTSTYTPRFDVREEADSFVLSGELPGIARENVNIEFTDAHTLAVSGRTIREYASGDQSLAPASSNAAQAESPTATIEATDAPAAPAVNDTDMTDHNDAASANYRPASVEDEDFVDVGSDKPAASPAPADATDNASAPATAEPAAAPAAAPSAVTATDATDATPKARYWVSERSVGTFRRSFTFTGEVDHEQVHASLRDGLLNIVVPKKARSVQRIAIE